MKIRDTDTGATGRFQSRSPAAVTTRRKRMGARTRRGIERITIPSVAEVERRMQGRTGFLSSLTPEQLAAFDKYDQPEVLGRNGPKRRPSS